MAQMAATARARSHMDRRPGEKMVLALGMTQPHADATNVTIRHAGSQATAVGAFPAIRRHHQSQAR